jgi:integral membrane sensor domain MASE1
MGFHERLERRAITVVTDLQADVPAGAANHSGNRWSIRIPRAMTTGLIGTTTGRIGWISVLVTFLASVLVEFIGFGHIIR